jgi:membrane fusion protein (multidrug efflux system)
MNTSAGNDATPTTPSSRPARRTPLIAGTAIAAALLAAWAAHWWRDARFVESTDDAYVRADVVTASPRVSGHVASVAVDDDQPVRRGDVLATLDDRDYRARADAADAAVAGAQAALRESEAGTRTLEAQLTQQASAIAQAQSDVDAARAESARRDADAQRYRALLDERATSDQRWETAHAEALKARAQLARATAAAQAQGEQQEVLRRRREQDSAAIESARARLAEAQARRELARQDLDRTRIVAAQDGTVGQRSVRVGQYVEAGTPLMAVVPLREVYVVANFKETQLAAIRPGQPVELDVDTFSGRRLGGRVRSIAPGSGAQFALLPPDNATGNFTKVVQRVPVRIALDPLPAGVVLRPGMSVVARIDTREARP